MIRTAIFGAGQAGRMIRNWLPAAHELICYIDNNRAKQGIMIGNVPVVSLERALTFEPDRIWIASLNRESAASIEEQILAAGFGGTIRYAHAFRDAQDLRIAELRLLVPEIEAKDREGDIAELGVYKGEFAAELNRLFPDRDLYLFDTFEGFSESDLKIEKELTNGIASWHPDFKDTCIEEVRAKLLYPEKAHFVKGRFPDSADRLEGNERYLLVNIDPDLYEPTHQGLEYFWPRMVRGGIIMIHDYNSLQFPGVRKAVREFAERYGIMPVPLADLHGTAIVIKG